MLNRIFRLTVVLSLLTICANTQAQLVAHYPFDTNFEDVSGLGNHGTAEGGALLVSDVPAGLTGQSLLLEENEDYVLVDHDASLDMTEAMTVSAWIKTEGDAWEGLLGKNPSEGSPDNHAGNYEIRVENGTNQLHFLYQQGGVSDTAFPISDDPLAIIEPGTWTHIAVTVEQIGDAVGEVNYYTNGVLADTKPINVGFGATNENPLYIGTRADLFTQFNGNIDELRIYNTVLFGHEVEGLFQGIEPDFSAPVPVAGANVVGNVTVSSSIGNLQFSEPSEEMLSGLGQSWYAVRNPGNKSGVDAIFETNERAVPYFQAESGITWWSGSADVPDVPLYPSEVDGVITGDNYTVKLEGEILIEESGTIRFLDGVDDYTYLAIDLDNNGTAGDTEAEVIIDDNAWTNALSTANNGAPIVEVDFENIANGGEWRAIEFNMAEGGGGDHGMLYWDVFDEDEFFPQDQGEGILDIDAAVFMIPDTHLRSPAEPAQLIAGEAVGTIRTRPAGLEIDVNPADGTADTITVETSDENVFTTILDLDGVVLAVNPLGEVTDGSSFRVVNADAVTGTPTIATEGWSFDVETGSVVFGEAGSSCETLAESRLPGDADGSGDVGFLDFLALANNFGTEAGYEGGNFDCSGTVSFLDFLTLANNFGKSAATSVNSVPEPPSGNLLGMTVMIFGLLRRRRYS